MSEVIDAYCTLGTERDTRLTPTELSQWMDEAGIHRAVVVPEDREIVAHNTSGNRRVAEISRQSHGRFIPACTVNPWFGPSACQELRRAVADGARMLVLAPALQGFCFGDDLPDQLLAVAAELHVPVYVHTGPHSFGAPTQVIVAAAEHPGARFILGHCGSTDFARDMPDAIRLASENVWFEVSLLDPWAAAQYVKIGDRRKLIFGSSAPRSNPVYDLQALRAMLPIEDYTDVYGGNLAALLAEVQS
jgi:predicted TIM-barrel fold metal-dependent hydrolase